jgi:hypothetical protein
MSVKLSSIDNELMVKIYSAKARGVQVFTLSAISANSLARLISSGFAQDINGFAYLTDKGLKKVKKL